MKIHPITYWSIGIALVIVLAEALMPSSRPSLPPECANLHAVQAPDNILALRHALDENNAMLRRAQVCLKKMEG